MQRYSSFESCALQSKHMEFIMAEWLDEWSWWPFLLSPENVQHQNLYCWCKPQMFKIIMKHIGFYFICDVVSVSLGASRDLGPNLEKLLSMCLKLSKYLCAFLNTDASLKWCLDCCIDCLNHLSTFHSACNYIECVKPDHPN